MADPRINSEKRAEEAAAKKIEASVQIPETSDAEVTAALLSDLVNYIGRFVILTAEQRHVVALWVLHTYTFNDFEQTPYLHIRAPEKQSGKTRLMEVLNLLVHDPWMVQMPSEAVLFRKIDESHPTLLLDEVDAIFHTNGDANVEGVRALLNGGNREESCVPRLVGGGLTPFDFSVFCPKALAGIGEIPDTVADRAIPIFLKRKTPKETVERFRRRLDGVSRPAAELRGRMEAWANLNHQALKDSWPELPEVLSDRQMDNVEPLLAIADMATPPEDETSTEPVASWAAYSRAALIGIYSRYSEGEEASLGLKLLEDCRMVFQALGSPEHLRSSQLVEELIGLEESPWGSLEKPLTTNKLSFLLGKYEIRNKPVRFEDPAIGQQRAYELAVFEDAWQHWLPEPLPAP